MQFPARLRAGLGVTRSKASGKSPNMIRNASSASNTSPTSLARRRCFAMRPRRCWRSRMPARRNLGVTVDFAHSLYCGEQPAYAAHLIHRRSRLLGVHLNDGYAKRDDGLMVGAVHMRCRRSSCCARSAARATRGRCISTLSRMLAGSIPSHECEANIATVPPDALGRRSHRRRQPSVRSHGATGCRLRPGDRPGLMFGGS
jgi:hypothetical protein